MRKVTNVSGATIGMRVMEVSTSQETRPDGSTYEVSHLVGTWRFRLEPGKSAIVPDDARYWSAFELDDISKDGVGGEGPNHGRILADAVRDDGPIDDAPPATHLGAPDAALAEPVLIAAPPAAPKE